MLTVVTRHGLTVLVAMLLTACGSGGSGGDGGTGSETGGGGGGDMVCPNNTIPDNTIVLGYMPPRPPASCAAKTTAIASCLRAQAGICDSNGQAVSSVANTARMGACMMQATEARNCGLCAIFTDLPFMFTATPTASMGRLSGTINQDATSYDPSCEVLASGNMPVQGAVCRVSATGPSSSIVSGSGPAGAALPAGTYQLRVTLRSRLGAPESECPSKSFTSNPVTF